MRHYFKAWKQNRSTMRLTRSGGLLLLTLMLNVCQGCSTSFNLTVENTTNANVTIVSVPEFNEGGVLKPDGAINLGTVAQGSTVTFKHVLYDAPDVYVLQVKDAANHILGEVRQPWATVHDNLKDNTWTVKIPADMTPIRASQSGSTASR